MTNISDPLSQAQRQISSYVEKFDGNNTIGQMFLLRYKPTSTGPVKVFVGGTLQTITTNYTLDRTNATITTVTAFATGNSNVLIQYEHVKGWVYEDHPIIGSEFFPRISVRPLKNTKRIMGQGAYYYGNIGLMQQTAFAIDFWTKKDVKITISGSEYNERDLLRYFEKQISDLLFKKRLYGNRFPHWHDIQEISSEEITTENESGIYRWEFIVQLDYFTNIANTNTQTFPNLGTG
jgi:hypothetical protein